MQTRVLDLARRMKHGGFVLSKSVRPARIHLLGAATRATERIIPRSFRTERYLDPRGYFPFDYFLDRTPPTEMVVDALPVQQVIYCFWTGNNPLTPNRESGLAALQAQNPETPVVLVTPDNLDEFIVEGQPLHPAFEHLSLVHKSDYLRCYFMHFHGGGYSDIKAPTHSWASSFDAFADPDVWLVGYPEVDYDICANLGGRIGRDVRAAWSRLVGESAFIARPRTPLTSQWYSELMRRMDYYSRDLTQYPATDAFGNVPGYPVTWIGINSLILHPLQLKYLGHLRQDMRLRPDFTDYR